MPDEALSQKDCTEQLIPEMTHIDTITVMEAKNGRLYGIAFHQGSRLLASAGRIFDKEYQNSPEFPQRKIRLEPNQKVVGITSSQRMFTDARHYLVDFIIANVSKLRD